MNNEYIQYPTSYNSVTNWKTLFKNGVPWNSTLVRNRVVSGLTINFTHIPQYLYGSTRMFERWHIYAWSGTPLYHNINHNRQASHTTLAKKILPDINIGFINYVPIAIPAARQSGSWPVFVIESMKRHRSFLVLQSIAITGHGYPNFERFDSYHINKIKIKLKQHKIGVRNENAVYVLTRNG